MSEIKLQVGKTYRSREGEEVKITGCDGGYYQPYKGTNGEWYTEGGKWQSSPEESPKDLIEEVTATRHTFAIPDGVKKVTVVQAGNRIIVEMVPEERKEPKPGDVMINRFGSVYIFKSAVDKHSHEHYAWLGTSGRLAIDTKCDPGRPATPEEAQPLWDALKKAGKRWNSETMQVEDVPEIDRICEWVEKHLNCRYYSHESLTKVIYDYLKYKEGKK
jgi:hypothetical protein